MGLRICSGAFRTSPVESLYVDTHQLPLDLQREELGHRCLMRIKCNPDNPSNKVICQVDASKFGPRSSTPFQGRFDQSVNDLPLKTQSILEVIPSRVPPWLIPKAKLCQKGRKVLLIKCVNRPPLECRLNWIPDPTPTPPRNHNKENHPPAAEHAKMRPRRKRREHQQQPGTSGSVPGISQPPRSQRSTPVKHPQLPQPHQPPRPAANENSSRAHLPDQPGPGRLYKQAHPNISKDTTTRSRRDNFSGSNLSFSYAQRSHRDYFSGSPCRAFNKNWHMTDPLQEASSVSLTAVRESTDPVQTPPHAALPDVVIDVGLEPPEAAATARIQRTDRPPVVLEIPYSTPGPSEPSQCPDKTGQRFQPPARGSKRPRTNSPPSPRRPRKRPSSHGRWCE